MESILIVDDDIQLSSLLREELMEVGFDTQSVNSAEEALTYLKEHPVDLILLDLNMPEKDGFYVLTQLRERNTPHRVIVLTGYADVQSAITSAKLGARDFITKPYDLDELLIAIRKVLNQSLD